MPSSSRSEVNIFGGRIIEAGTYNEHVFGSKKTGLEILQEYVAAGALHNSGERFDPPRCHPETRTAVLDMIANWAESENSESTQNIKWLSGPAGAGKSAIAQTLAEQWDREGILAASFFFSRTAAQRNEKTFIVGTILYQLLRSYPYLRRPVELAIEDDPLIFRKTLISQIEVLVISICMASPLIPSPKAAQQTKVIVIDGLDECNGEGSQKEVLSVLSTLLDQCNIPLRIFVTSRPEQQLRDAFDDPDLRRHTSHIVLDDSFDPRADIDLFLRCKFQEIKSRYRIKDEQWPSEEVLETLIQKSSGQFIYASTVVKYISPPHNDPRRCLQVVLGLETPGNDTPYAPLDALYTHIMSCIAPSSFYVAMDVFSCFFAEAVNAWNRGTMSQITSHLLERLFYIDSDQIYRHLIDLHSILHIPVEGEEPFRFYHASFGDFLADQNRSGKFYLSSPEAHRRLTKLYFRHLLEGMATNVSMAVNAVWWHVASQLFDHMALSAPDSILKGQLEMCLWANNSDFSQMLSEFGIPQCSSKPDLFQVIEFCIYRTRILDYLTRCYKSQETKGFRRLLAEMKLIPYRSRALIIFATCTRSGCTKPGHPMFAWKELLRNKGLPKSKPKVAKQRQGSLEGSWGETAG